MRDLTIKEKIHIYFSGYRTGGSCTVQEYLTIADEVRKNLKFKNEIEKETKINKEE